MESKQDNTNTNTMNSRRRYKSFTTACVSTLPLLLAITTSSQIIGTTAFLTPSFKSRHSSIKFNSRSHHPSTQSSQSSQSSTTNLNVSTNSNSKNLFDVESIENDNNKKENNSFQVKDMSSFQQFDDDDYEDDEIDMNADVGSYNIDYDDDEMYDTKNDNPWNDSIDVSWDAETLSDDETATDHDYSRDQDDVLTEREDRLYVDENGHRRKIETCLLIGVEDLSAMRRDRRKSTLQNSSASKTLSKNPEEWEVYFTLEESLEEMRDLIQTAGMSLVGEIYQRLNDVNPKTYIGTGKVKEAMEMLEERDCCTVVFDAELSPGQQKALENAFNKGLIQNDFLGADMGEIKVIDRTALILDIFAQHAKTREGKLQVDLALHEYRKPRLTKMWTHLERQSGSGGVGLRGPGESQLEIDRRLVRDRIIVLKRKIDAVQKQRDIHRRGRERMGLPILALVGYTNAGKSTLLNHLTRAGVMAEDILFATLDPTTRKVKLPGLKTHPEVLLTDTVGFIQKLPTNLVAAFRATLEEVKEADVLVHVMDVANPVWSKQEKAVLQVLSEIGAGDKPVVRVLNKIDLLEDDVAEDLQYEAAMAPGHSVAISSVEGTGMVDFVATVEDAMMSLLVPIEVLLPYANGKEVNIVQEVGHVENIEYLEDGTYMQARVPESVASRLRPFYVGEGAEDGGSIQGDASSDAEEEIDWVAIGRGRHTTQKD